jgi:hypothetical protein
VEVRVILTLILIWKLDSAEVLYLRRYNVAQSVEELTEVSEERVASIFRVEE